MVEPANCSAGKYNGSWEEGRRSSLTHWQKDCAVMFGFPCECVLSDPLCCLLVQFLVSIESNPFVLALFPLLQYSLVLEELLPEFGNSFVAVANNRSSFMCCINDAHPLSCLEALSKENSQHVSVVKWETQDEFIENILGAFVVEGVIFSLSYSSLLTSGSSTTDAPSVGSCGGRECSCWTGSGGARARRRDNVRGVMSRGGGGEMTGTWLLPALARALLAATSLALLSFIILLVLHGRLSAISAVFQHSSIALTRRCGCALVNYVIISMATTQTLQYEWSDFSFHFRDKTNCYFGLFFMLILPEQVILLYHLLKKLFRNVYLEIYAGRHYRKIQVDYRLAATDGNVEAKLKMMPRHFFTLVHSLTILIKHQKGCLPF